MHRVHMLFLASGATALVYQVAWLRRLSLVFGASFEAVALVLAAFMGGLAAGGFWLGRRAESTQRPLRLYGLLEIGVAVFAIALPWLLGALDAIYLDLAREGGGQASATLNAARFGLAFSVLLLPTFFMGGTLPVLVRFAVRHYGELGERLSLLYAINTAGAVAGTLLAGFVLLPALGLWRTEAVAIVANLLIGAGALAIDRSLASAGAAAARAGSSAAPGWGTDADETAYPDPGPPGRLERLAFWGTAVAGLASLALEVAWTRAIAVACGANTYSFTVMLATFLVGIALGSRLHGRFRADPGTVGLRFGLVMLAIGASSAVVSALIPRLPQLVLWMESAGLVGGGGLRAGATFALSGLVMLGPCILMGLAFPLSGEARARFDDRFGRSVGDLVGLNTLGAIAGSLLAGFVLLPGVGLQRTMLLANAAYAGYGLLVLAVAWAIRRPRSRSVAWASATLVIPLTLLVAWMMPSWDPRSLSAVTNNDRSLYLDAAGRLDFRAGFDRTALLYVREGRGSTASVIRNGDVRSLLINGKVVATDELGDMQHEYLLGHLPTLLHPRPRSAAVIGLGAGLTLGGVVSEPGLERIVVVEIEPAVEGAARVFSDIHGDALDDPRVELVWQDGRNYLATTPERFDVVTADPIHPWAQGAAYLYTTEYYAMVRGRLRPGGIACQWLPLYELSEDDLRSVVAAFVPSFEHATLWQATGDLLLIGSDTPIEVDLDALAARLAAPERARQLARAGLDEPLAFLAEYAMGRAAMERFAEGATVNTDDNLRLEFSSPLSIGINPLRHLPTFNRLRENAAAVVRGSPGRSSDRDALESALDGFRAAKSHVIDATPRWHGHSTAPSVAGLREMAGEYRSALEKGPGYRPARVLLARSESLLGELHLRAGKRDPALAAFRRALAADPGDATANLHVALALARQQRPDDARRHLERAVWRKPQSVDAQAALGQLLMQQGRYEEALARFEVAAVLRPDLEEVARLRCACLRRLGAGAETLADCEPGA